MYRKLHITAIPYILALLFAAFCLLPTEANAQEGAVGTVTAEPSGISVIVDGVPVVMEAYCIDGSNYIKLRDLAMAVKDSTKAFRIVNTMEATVSLFTGSAYSPVGGELDRQVGRVPKQALPRALTVLTDGEPVDVRAYGIDGSDYFSLRDLAEALELHIAWNELSLTVGIDTQPICFNEESLETALRTALNIGKGDIYPSDLRTLETLSLSGTGVADIGPLRYCANLKTLDLSSNRIMNIIPLEGLRKLTNLDLSNNLLEEISPLSKLVFLRFLNLGNNRIPDIRVLTNFRLLESLNITENPTADLNALALLPRLVDLTLGGNSACGVDMPDLTPILSQLTKLRRVTLLEYGRSLRSLIAALPNLSQFNYVSGGTTLDCLNPNSLDLYEFYSAKIDTLVKSINSTCRTDAEKEMAVHDYLVSHVAYDNVQKSPSMGSFGAIAYGSAISFGYAKTMSLVLNRCGVTCLTVTGTMNKNDYYHMWNIVKIDGKYYHVNTTLDDSDPPTTEYFNVTDAFMSQSFKWPTDYYPACTNSWVW